MKTDIDIVTKMNLMDSPNWPEGQVARALLNEYHMEIRPLTEKSVLLDLEAEVLVAKLYELDGEVIRAKLSMVKIMIIVWLLDNQDLLRKISSVPVDLNSIGDRLAVVCQHYNIVDPIGQSEEE